MRTRSRQLIFALVAVLAVMAMPAAAYHDGFPEYPHDYGNDAFLETWERTDRPVADLVVSRTWMWGPQPYTNWMMERSDESPGGMRMVQYFDKSRMEITYPGVDEDELWYVTNGRLAIEMIEGRYEVATGVFIESEPAMIPAAGDPDDPDSPTYATLTDLLDEPPAATEGDSIIRRLDGDGMLSDEPDLAEYGVETGPFVEETDHRVASVFWEFMTSEGLIWNGEEYVNESLFENPFYATGFPVTEAYWTEVDLNGIATDVLLQCFERRCLTYTPDNPEGFEVEAGNVGQHYYRWRYGDSGPTTEQVNIFLIAEGDNGQSGIPVGCGDSLIDVIVEIEATTSLEGRIVGALTALFAVEDQYYGESGYFNAFYLSELVVRSVQIDGGTATIDLAGPLAIGGVCDQPRVEEAIRETILQFDGANEVVITYYGQPLFVPST